MIPKVEGPEDIHYVDRLLAQLEAKAGLDRPILVHAILETARGVANVEEICAASPRMQGLVARPGRPRRQPPDEDDACRRRPPRLPRARRPRPGRCPTRRAPTYQQDLWHYTIARMVDACVTYGVLPYYGPFGDIADTVACEDQFRNAYLLGCVGAWSLHPAQVEIAKRVFSPARDVAHARRVIEAMGDGTGAVLLDGKMEDDASVKQCKVVVELAEQLAARDPELAAPTGSRQVTRVPDDRPAPPLGALHAGGQRPGAREGQDDPVRRDHLRPRGRRRPRRQADRPRAGRRRRDVGRVRPPRADDPLQRPVHAVGRRRPRRRRRGGARRPS